MVCGGFDFAREVAHEDFGFGESAFGGRIFGARGVAETENVLGGGGEVFVDEDAGTFVFDAGVVETEVFDVGSGAGGEGDAVDADHFFLGFASKNGDAGGGVLVEGDKARAGENGDVEVFGEVAVNGVADFFVLFGKEAGGAFHDDDFGTELGVKSGDFDAGGAAADDEGAFGEATDAEGGVGGEVVDAV